MDMDSYYIPGRYCQVYSWASFVIYLNFNTSSTSESNLCPEPTKFSECWLSETYFPILTSVSIGSYDFAGCIIDSVFLTEHNNAYQPIPGFISKLIKHTLHDPSGDGFAILNSIGCLLGKHGEV